MRYSNYIKLISISLPEYQVTYTLKDKRNVTFGLLHLIRLDLRIVWIREEGEGGEKGAVFVDDLQPEHGGGITSQRYVDNVMTLVVA